MTRQDQTGAPTKIDTAVLRPMRILLIDQGKEAAEALRAYLAGEKRTPFVWRAAASLSRALDLLRVELPDVIVLNLSLPDGNGEEILLQMQHRAPQIPIILLFESEEEKASLSIARFGIQDYLIRSQINPHWMIRSINYAIDRKRTEMTLRENCNQIHELQMRYQAILRSTPLGLCMLSPEWKIMWANHSMGRLLDPDGTVTLKIVGCSFRVLFADDIRFVTYRTSVEKAMPIHGTDVRQVELIQCDGTPFLGEITITRVDSTQGSPGYVITLNDVTEQRRVEEERESLHRFSEQLAARLTLRELGQLISRECQRRFSHDALWFNFYDADRNLLDGIWEEDTPPGHSHPIEMNTPGTLEPRHASRAEFYSRPRLINRLQDPVHSEFVPYGVKKRLSRSLMFAPIRWEGRVLAVLSVQSYTPDKYGDRHLASLQALADHCGAALFRIQTEDALRQSEARLRMMVEQIPAILTVTDRQFSITYAAGIGLGRIGLNPSDLMGKTIYDFYTGAGPDFPVFDSMKKALVGESSSYETHWRDKVYQSYTEPLHNSEGNIIGTLGIGLDITELKQAEQEQLRLQHELMAHERMAAIGRTMASVSHCMKNIFTALNGGIFLMEQSTKNADWDLAHKAADMLHRSYMRLNLLSMNMLDYSKKREAIREEFSVVPLLDELKQMLSRDAENKHVQIETHVEPGAEIVCLDSPRLFRALLNLGCNAIDAMPQGGHLRFSASRVNPDDLSGGAAMVLPEQPPAGNPLSLLEVQDTGTGISPELFLRLFETSFSTKGSRGTGLGLPSVRQFVEDYQGQIRIDSQMGKGTRFRMIFNLEAGPPTPEETI